jgi:tetratricopeptide (TPR) repeat protein
LLLVALVLRVVHLLTVRDSPFFRILYIDPGYYDEWGLRIAGGELVGARPFFLDPLYPYFLGAIYALFGHSYQAVAAVQGLLGAFVPPLVLLAARPWFSAPTARLAGLIAAIYLPAVYFGGLLMKPGVSLFLATLTMYLISRGLVGAARATWLGAGVAAGLTCLSRGNTILVVPLLVLWILMRADENVTGGWLDRLRDALRRRSRRIEAVLFAIGTVVVLAVPATHNYAVGGEFILSTANAGANFFIGNNPSNRSGEYQQLPFVNANPKYEQRDFSREAERRAGRELSDRETSAFWFAESARWIREDPAAWSALMFRKVRSFWGAYEQPDSLDFYLYREQAPVLRLPLPGFGLLAPFALLGVALSLRRRGWPRMLLWFMLAYSTTVIFFFVFSRFRMVLAPALYVFAAHGAVELIRRWRTRPPLQALAATALLVGLLVFVNFPVRARTDTWSYRLARAAHLPTRPETSALGSFNLGAAYARLAKEQEERSDELLALAEKSLRRALADQTDADHARMQVELGKVLARQQRNQEAIGLYEQAAEIEPNDYRIHHSLGLLYSREGEDENAASAFGRALTIAPRHVASATRLGQALFATGRRVEAERAFRHALALSPEDSAALQGLRELGVQP